MPKRKFIILFCMVAITALSLTAFDEWRQPVLPPWDEIAVDFFDQLLLLAAMAGVAWTFQSMRDLQDGQVALSNNLARAVAQGDVWREQRRGEIAALGQAIAEQFRTWKLSAAEVDIAGLMLKGASLKEIALARDTSEATIRQQAQSIYRKSGLSGRAELSAYFLETLFTEAEDTAARRLSLVSTGPNV